MTSPPPAAPIPLGPPPQLMPAAPKAAMVLLWVVFGFGICGGLASGFGAAVLVAAEESGQVILPAAFMPLLAASLVQITVWTVLRAVFAVKISRRRRTGRTGAIILESAGLALSALSWIVTPDIEVIGAQAQTNEGATLVGAVLGAAISATIIGLLMTEAAKDWCDR